MQTRTRCIKAFLSSAIGYFALAAALMLWSFNAAAVPASPEPVDVMQPWLWAWTQVVQMPQRRREMARWTPQTLLA